MGLCTIGEIHLMQSSSTIHSPFRVPTYLVLRSHRTDAMVMSCCHRCQSQDSFPRTYIHYVSWPSFSMRCALSPNSGHLNLGPSLCRPGPRMIFIPGIISLPETKPQGHSSLWGVVRSMSSFLRLCQVYGSTVGRLWRRTSGS